MYRNKSVYENTIVENRYSEKRLIASKYKVAAHKGKIEKYLKDGRIYPVTLELDLTSRCNMNCPDCPSGRADKTDNLNISFIDRLLSILGHNTEGLLLTGGETTISPLFSSTLKKAREKGFRNIAVVTNGSRLGDLPVYSALLEHASTIRISMYDSKKTVCEGSGPTLKKIEILRNRIEKSGSKLEIGVSILTREHNRSELKKISEEIESAGAHWVYFHPFCSKWSIGEPEIVEQADTEQMILELKQSEENKIEIFYPKDRYSDEEISFNGYHGSHFLMVVGADGKNYLGAETKYDPSMVIADLNENMGDNFLWDQERIKKISSVMSNSFKAIRSRHRGGLYSDLIERLKKKEERYFPYFENPNYFKYPFIL